MTTYRVGSQGATVFSPDGEPLTWLPPGHVVVPGSTDVVPEGDDIRAPQGLAQSPAAEHHDTEQKRRSGYADKQLRPEQDKG